MSIRVPFTILTTLLTYQLLAHSSTQFDSEDLQLFESIRQDTSFADIKENQKIIFSNVISEDCQRYAQMQADFYERILSFHAKHALPAKALSLCSEIDYLMKSLYRQDSEDTINQILSQIHQRLVAIVSLSKDVMEEPILRSTEAKAAW